MTDSISRTLLEAGEVPFLEWRRLTRGTGVHDRRESGRPSVVADGTETVRSRSVLSPWARAVAAGLALKEGDGEQFQQRCALENPLGDAVVLELSGVASTTATSMNAMKTMATVVAAPAEKPLAQEGSTQRPDRHDRHGNTGSGYSGLTREVRPLGPLRHLSAPDALLAVPAGSVDVLICAATCLSRVSSQWLAGQSQNREGGSSRPGRDAPEARPASGAEDVAEVDGCPFDGQGLQRDYLLWLLAQFKRIVKSDGTCLLAYQHMLASAWATLGEALVASGWTCCGAVPFPAPIQPVLRDPYLYRRTLAWDALLVCRSQPYDADPPCQVVPKMQVVVESTCPKRASVRVTELCKATNKRLKMRDADRMNLWRALLVAEAHGVGPADSGQIARSEAAGKAGDHRDRAEGVANGPLHSILLSDALRSEPAW